MKAAATARLDADLKAGLITKAQRDDMLEHLAEHVERLGERPVLRHRHGHRGPTGPPPAAP